MSLLRTFIAIPIPLESDIITAWEHLMDSTGADSIRWVKPDGVHLTLVFLGATPEEQIHRIKQRLGGLVSYFNPFAISIRGFGYFGTAQSPRIVWAGIEDSAQLRRLQQEVQDVITGFNFETSTSVFNPHITLGRVKSLGQQDDLIQFIDKQRDTYFQSVDVTSISLLKSDLHPTGAIYTEVFRCDMGMYKH